MTEPRNIVYSTLVHCETGLLTGLGLDVGQGWVMFVGKSKHSQGLLLVFYIQSFYLWLLYLQSHHHIMFVPYGESRIQPYFSVV